MRFVSFVAFVLSAACVAALLIPLSLFPENIRLRICAGLLCSWSRLTLKIFRIRVHERSSEEQTLDPRARVIVANHVSYLDIAVLLSRGPCTFVAKAEVSRWPLIGWIGRQSGMVFVERASLWSRAHSLLQLQSRLQQGMDIVVFPEGSTSLEGPRRRLSNFFAGAFRIARMESAPVEMVYLDYSNPERCAWLGDDAFVPHLWALYSKAGSRVNLRSETVQEVRDRRHQRRVHGYCRNWLLEGGRNLKFLSSEGI